MLDWPATAAREEPTALAVIAKPFCVAALAPMGHNRSMSAAVDASAEGGTASETGPRAFRYDAFISYSHSAAVGLPAALQRGFERFAKKAWQPRPLRVDRDRPT